MIRNVYIFALLILSCNGQLNTLTSLVTDTLTNNPIVRFSTYLTSDTLSNTVDIITQFPNAIARALSYGINIPTLITDDNLVDTTGKFIADFYSDVSNEDARLSINKLIPKYGYPVEKHNVITEDGYMISMFRIPSNGSVVFLMHGLLGSADDFIIAGPESGLAYLLAKEGYDVWMGNARGNKYSRRHVKLKPSEAAFWDFSWHEIGIFDLPKMIDYVLLTTNSKTLKYIGHSQGTTAFFVMASEKPQYNSKISLMVALSPVAYMANVRSPIVRLLAPGGPLIHSATKLLGIYEFLPDNAMIRTLKALMCGSGSLAEILCNNIVFLIAGFDLEQLNVTNLPVELGHFPSGSSARQLVHYGQNVISNEFQKYDYGFLENIQRYGEVKPPSYNLNTVNAPVSLFYSESDWLAHPVDVDRLYNELGNAIDIHKIPYDRFNHLDFLLAKDLKKLVFNRLRKLIALF